MSKQPEQMTRPQLLHEVIYYRELLANIEKSRQELMRETQRQKKELALLRALTTFYIEQEKERD